MPKMTHAIAWRDRQYLWGISPASDMTGAYVDQEDLEKLLEKPTAAVAVDCLTRQISYWFEAGTEDGGREQSERELRDDPEVQAIYQRHVGTLPSELDEEE